MNKMLPLIACVVCLIIGYSAGREHAKIDFQQEAKAALERSEAATVENFKAAEESAKKATCINILRQLDGAKEQWALEMQKNEGDAVEAAAISRFLLRESLPPCPAGGRYSLGSVGEPPTCSENGHALGGF